MEKPLALDYSLSNWKEWVLKQGLPAFTGEQIYQWIFEKENVNPLTFSNLSQGLRHLLNESFTWQAFTIDSCLTSLDASQKILLKTVDNLLIEMVVMPYDNRATLCLSCQVGCKMGCTFCQTGKLGLKRDLSCGEILAQLLIANQELQKKGLEKITNVVFMGMGEPLDNYNEVVKACRVMIDEKAFGLSKQRVTVSTSGLIPEIQKLAVDLPVRLAISLHSADDEQRSKMMPVNRRYPLAELKKVLLTYPAPKRYGITFEYVMIKGVNDSLLHAKKLVHFLHGLKAKVNLIPINNFPGIEMHPSDAEPIRLFQAYLTERSIPAPVRYSRGQDISGGCGQLATKRANELHLDPRHVRRLRFSITNS